MPMRDRNPPSLTMPEYKAKAQLVYDEIRRAIQEGDLKPGDRLIAEELAAHLHVSRMPVREAIQRLQLEGLVDMIPYRGATVAMVTREQLKQLFSVRAVLEGLASREAAILATAQDIARLEAMYRLMERAVQGGDTEGQLARNREIHAILWQVTGNALLQSMAAGLFDSIERYRLQLMRLPSIPEGALAEHREIIDAIASHDPERAERLTRAHIERTGRLMEGYADESARPEEYP